MIKAFLCDAASPKHVDKPGYRDLLVRLQGAIFLATPHTGSALAGCCPGGAVMQRLVPYNNANYDVQDAFDQLVSNANGQLHGLRLLAVAEGARFSFGWLGDLLCGCLRSQVVARAAALPVGTIWTRAETKLDHKAIAKISTVEHETWTHVGPFLQKCLFMNSEGCAFHHLDADMLCRFMQINRFCQTAASCMHVDCL